MLEVCIIFSLITCVGCIYFAFRYITYKRSISTQMAGKLRVIFEEDEEQPHVFLELQDKSVFNENTKTVLLEVTHEKPSL